MDRFTGMHKEVCIDRCADSCMDLLNVSLGLLHSELTLDLFRTSILVSVHLSAHILMHMS